MSEWMWTYDDRAPERERAKLAEVDLAQRLAQLHGLHRVAAHVESEDAARHRGPESNAPASAVPRPARAHRTRHE